MTLQKLTQEEIENLNKPIAIKQAELLINNSWPPLPYPKRNNT